MSGKTFMLFSHLCNPGHMSGAEKFALFMLRELSLFHRCMLVVPSEGLLAQQARSFGFDVIVAEYSLMWQMWNPGPQLGEEEEYYRGTPQFRSLLNVLHIHRPDAVIVNTCVNALPALAASRLGIPVLWLITEVMRDGPWMPQAASLIDRSSTWIAGISNACLQAIRRYVPSGKTMLLYPSWQPDSLHPATWQANRRRLRANLSVDAHEILVGCVVSDIAAHKGIDHFIEMAVRICPLLSTVHFMIVGNPTEQPYFDQCIQNIHQSGFASRFKILPFGSQIETFFPAMDAAVVPSLVEEGFGLTALEAMVFGKPVIAYRSGGLEEMLNRIGMDRLLAARGDIEQLTAAVLAVVRNPKECQSLGSVCQQAVTVHYGIQAYRNRLGQLLHTVEPALATLADYHAASRAAVPDGVLLSGAQTPAVFLIEGGRKRPFRSEATFSAHGYGWHQVQTVDDAMLQWFPTGDPL